MSFDAHRFGDFSDSDCFLSDIDALYDNPLVKTIKFDVYDQTLTCQDFLFEPKIAFRFPLQVLRILRGNVYSLAELLRSTLRALPQRSKKYDLTKNAHLSRLDEILKIYETAEIFLDTYAGPSFKASLLKDKKEYGIVPCNLHIQRFCVLKAPQSTESRRYVDYVTCGAFTAFDQGYALGGCKRMGGKLAQRISSRGLPNALDLVEWSRVTLFCHTVAEAGHQLEQLKTTFNSKAWIEMSTDEFINFASNIDEVRKQLRKLCESESIFVINLENVVDSPMECLESNFNDLDAEFACLSTKTQNLVLFIESKNVYTNSNELNNDSATNCKAASIENADVYKSSLHQSTFNVLNRMEKLLVLVRDCYSFRFLHLLNADDVITLYYDLIYRKNAILSQALTTVCSALLHKLWNDAAVDSCSVNRLEKIFDCFTQWYDSGALLTVHSFLSCYQDEKGMIEDLAEALRMLSTCRFRLVKSFANVRNVCQPLVEGKGADELRISLPIPRRLLDALETKPRPLSVNSNSPSIGDWFGVQVILVTMGINYEESLARTIGNLDLEHGINQKAYGDYAKYYEIWSRSENEKVDNLNINAAKSCHKLTKAHRNILVNLESFKSHLSAGKSKNVDLFTISRRLNESMNGSLILCCKSGKDRTAMGVTLNQVDFLVEHHNLTFDLYQRTLDELRRQGCRLDNTMKNVGARRYAFTGLQYSFLPQNYKPPKGTYGTGQT